MSRYTVQELLSKWATEEITVEQAVGQLVQQVKMLNEELGKAFDEINKLRTEISANKGKTSENGGGRFVANEK